MLGSRDAPAVNDEYEDDAAETGDWGGWANRNNDRNKNRSKKKAEEAAKAPP